MVIIIVFRTMQRPKRSAPAKQMVKACLKQPCAEHVRYVVIFREHPLGFFPELRASKDTGLGAGV